MDLNALGASAIWQPAETPAPQEYLAIVLHGRGDSAQGFTWLREALALPTLNTLLLNAPDPYYSGYSWYDFPPNQSPGILRSRSLLDQVLQEAHRQGFPPERCFLLGFSQGCLMTLEFGARYPHRLAGYVGISGYCFDPEALLREAALAPREGRWLITHGTRDDVLPVERTRSQMRSLIEGGLPIDYREYLKEHTIDPVLEFPEIREWLRSRMSAS